MIYHYWYSMFICRLFLYIISHIYSYVINAHINIKSLFPIINDLFIKLRFCFVVYITDFTGNRLKYGIHVITTQERTDKIQWLFSQWKCFVLIWTKQPIFSYTWCMVYIPNRVHQLDQGYMFTDIINNITPPLIFHCLILKQIHGSPFFCSWSSMIELVNMIISE